MGGKKIEDGVTSHVLTGKKVHETLCPGLKIQWLEMVNMLNRLSTTAVLP